MIRELGYVEGQNVAFEHRFAEGRMEKLDGLAAELVASAPDVIVVGPNTSVVAVMRASKTVPIVMTVSTVAGRQRISSKPESPRW